MVGRPGKQVASKLSAGAQDAAVAARCPRPLCAYARGGSAVQRGSHGARTGGPRRASACGPSRAARWQRATLARVLERGALTGGVKISV
jgi:hypothetical protein